MTVLQNTGSSVYGMYLCIYEDDVLISTSRWEYYTSEGYFVLCSVSASQRKLTISSFLSLEGIFEVYFSFKVRCCGDPAIYDSHHVSLVQWTNLFASRHKGHRFKSPGGYLCETGILLLAMSRYSVKKCFHSIIFF